MITSMLVRHNYAFQVPLVKMGSSRTRSEGVECYDSVKIAFCFHFQCRESLDCLSWKQKLKDKLTTKLLLLSLINYFPLDHKQ